ncbi:MAG: EcsC family protein [Clostridia bacterium]|nr:EcsC family protein [Clostridia bacterium]
MTPKSNLSPYEKSQIKKIWEWKNEEPGIVSLASKTVLSPFTGMIQKIVPETVIISALDFTQVFAVKFSGSEDILKNANIKNIKELKDKNLELSDSLADKIHKNAILLAAVEGAGTGLLGFAGFAADLAAVTALALRTIYKIGMCYGYDTTDHTDKNYMLGILSLATSNSKHEKDKALSCIKDIQERLAGEAASILIRNLAGQLSKNLIRRKTLSVFPVVGAAFGSSVNGWYMNDVALAAIRTFQERWLMDNGKVERI